MSLEPDGYHARAIELPAPTRDVKTMLTLIRLELEKTPPGAPVSGFSIVAHSDRPRRAQLSLFGPSALSPEKLATTIARLAAILGEDRIGMAQTVDTFIPGAYRMADYAPPPPPDLRQTPKRSRALIAARVFRPPIPIEVITRPSRPNEPGKIQIVSEHADVTVQEVGSFPDLKMKQVPAYPDRCGLWQLVETGGDTKIQFVSAFPDVRIQRVAAYPGLP